MIVAKHKNVRADIPGFWICECENGLYKVLCSFKTLKQLFQFPKSGKRPADNDFLSRDSLKAIVAALLAAVNFVCHRSLPLVSQALGHECERHLTCLRLHCTCHGEVFPCRPRL